MLFRDAVLNLRKPYIARRIFAIWARVIQPFLARQHKLLNSSMSIAFGLSCSFALRSSLRSSALALRIAHSFSFPLSSTRFAIFRNSFPSSPPMATAVEITDPVQKRLMFEDECILVDENDSVLGHDSKYNCHRMENIEAGKALHRAFSVFLFNKKHELLLQKRSATKVTFPLVWTNTCCSHPLYRESELIQEHDMGVKNAAQRKLYDELGIVAEDAPVDQFTCLGRILYKAPSDGKWGEHELDYLIFLVRDVKLNPNPDEVADVTYVNQEQLKELVRKADAGQDGIKLSPWFRLVVDNLLFDWWSKLESGTLSETQMKYIHKL